MFSFDGLGRIVYLFGVKVGGVLGCGLVMTELDPSRWRTGIRDRLGRFSQRGGSVAMEGVRLIERHRRLSFTVVLMFGLAVPLAPFAVSSVLEEVGISSGPDQVEYCHTDVPEFYEELGVKDGTHRNRSVKNMLLLELAKLDPQTEVSCELRPER